MRTQEEIDEEVKTLQDQLERVRPRSIFGDDNKAKVRAQIETLVEDVKECQLVEHFDDSDIEDAQQAIDWREGAEDAPPSEDWEPLCT